VVVRAARAECLGGPVLAAILSDLHVQALVG